MEIFLSDTGNEGKICLSNTIKIERILSVRGKNSLYEMASGYLGKNRHFDGMVVV